VIVESSSATPVSCGFVGVAAFYRDRHAEQLDC